MTAKQLFPKLPKDRTKRFIIVAILVVVLGLLQLMSFQESSLPIPHYQAPFVHIPATPACLTISATIRPSCVSSFFCTGLANPFSYEKGFPFETNLYNYFYSNSCFPPDLAIHWNVQIANWVFDAVVLYALYLGLIYLFNNDKSKVKAKTAQHHNTKTSTKKHIRPLANTIITHSINLRDK